MTDRNDILKVGARGLLLVLTAFTVVAGAENAMAEDARDGDGPDAEIAPDELQGFAVAYLEVLVLRGQLDREIGALIAESGLERERLYEIQDTGTDGLREREARAYRMVADGARALQQRYQSRMITAVADEDLTPERFEQITRALHADPELAARVQARIERLIAHRTGTRGAGDEDARSGG